MTLSITAKCYAGLDVSLKETAVCVVDEAGKIIFERMAQTDPQIIAATLEKHAQGLERFGLESGATSAWLWREFQKLGLPVICLDSRHAHRVLSMRRNKNDRNDARGLVELMRMGWFREARVRSPDAQFVRSLLLSRQQLLESRREIEWMGGVGRTNDPLLRSYLYEAAGVLMTRVRRNCNLKTWAKRLAKRIGWKRTSIAVARKSAVILHAVWRDGTLFEWQAAEPA